MVLFWFLLITLSIVLIQRYIFHKLGLRHVEYTRSFQTKHCFQHETTKMIEVISNKKTLPLPWLYVESSLEAALEFNHGDNFSVSSGSHFQNHQSYFTLGSHQKITRTHELVPKRRGVYNLKTVSLTTGDLLGFSSQVQQIPLESQLVVYPQPIELPWDQLPQHSFQGDHIVKRFIMPDPFLTAGTRPYMYGDSLKSVNWKATARTNTLHVHQYEFTANRKLLIIVNVDDHESMWRDVNNIELVESYLNVAAGISKQAIDQGIEVGFAANMKTMDSQASAWLDAARGDGHWYGLLELMAHLKLERTESIQELLIRIAHEGKHDYDVIIISAYWNDRAEEAAQWLRQNQNAVLVLQLDEPIHANVMEDVV